METPSADSIRMGEISGASNPSKSSMANRSTSQFTDEPALGPALGLALGLALDNTLGKEDGRELGLILGSVLGRELARKLGFVLGPNEGNSLLDDGLSLRSRVVGVLLGLAVGSSLISTTGGLVSP